MTYNEELISFFKRHNLYDEEMFKYLQSNTTILDYHNEEQRDFIGCFYTFVNNNILKSIHLNIPYVYDDITMLINIHEIIHGIELYKHLNKKTKITNMCEVLPILYEKIYIEETNNDNLRKYYEQVNNNIGRKDKRYKLAFSIVDNLYKQYDYNYEKVKKLSKELINQRKSYHQK